MSKAKLIRGLVFFVMVILFSQFALAIGLTPAKKIIDFIPSGKQSVMFSIYNNERKDFNALVSLKGELANYAKTKDIIVKITAQEEFKDLEFELDLPEKIDKPGVHESDIVVLELPRDAVSADDMPLVKAVPSIIAKLWLRVPFPHKYIESKIVIDEANVNETIKFTMPIFNYGQEKIEKATAVLQIYDGSNKIAELKTNEIPIDIKSQGVLSASWKADVNPGTYKVKALIEYNGHPLALEQDFSVGSLSVDITKIDIGIFTLGDIAKFDIYLESRWNKPISNVFGELIIFDKNGTLIATVKTASIDLQPLSAGKITAFWDTKGILVGSYDGKLAVYYEGKKTEKQFSINVNIDSITTNLAPTAQVIGKKGLGRENILLITIFVLIVINIGWFIYFKKFRKTAQ